MSSLSELCEISLMRNYLQLHDVKNVPYRLIKNILFKVKLEHLCKLEKSNVLLVFEDDELWLNFLRQDFPTSVHDCFVTKKDVIIQFYLKFIQENDPDLLKQDGDLINVHLQLFIRKELASGKFRKPYRMLYFEYQEDVVRKQEKSAERLRLQMEQIHEERKRKQTVVVDHSFYAQNQPRKTAKNLSKEHHSDLFRRSVKEHGSRLRHFKSGGFDIAKRHATRVAFGGAAGGGGHVQTGVAERKVPRNTINDPSIEQCDSNVQQQQLPAQLPVKKRRVDPPSIFLNRKRPNIVINKGGVGGESPTKTDTIRTQRQSPRQDHGEQTAVAGHKKKSALFSTPELSQLPDQHVSTTRTSPTTKQNRHNIYIFDKNRNQEPS